MKSFSLRCSMLMFTLFFSFSVLALDKITIKRGGGEDYGRDQIKSFIMTFIADKYGKVLTREHVYIFNKNCIDNEDVISETLRPQPSLQTIRGHIFKFLSRTQLNIFIAYSDEITLLKDRKVLVQYWTRDFSYQSVQFSLDDYYGILYL